MRCAFALLIVAALTVGSAYGVLRLFSRLAGVDMFAALSWSFSNRQYGLVLVAGFFYLVAFLCLLILLKQPLTLLEINASHEGALLGHSESSGAKLYDPVRREYRMYEKFWGMQAAEKFDDAFEVVAFYRDHRWDYYVRLNTGAQNWLGGLFAVFAVCVTFLIPCIIMYKLAELYIEKAGIDQILSHHAILANFKVVTGFSFPAVITTVLLIMLVPLFFGEYMTYRIKRGYEEQFSSVQNALKSELMSNVAPKKVLRGRVFGRERSHDEEPVSSSDMGSKRPTIPTGIYTIEFHGLVRYTPVYLSITRHDMIEKLDKLSYPDSGAAAAGESAWDKAREADAAREADFIVNDDYSVSPWQEGRRPASDVNP